MVKYASLNSTMVRLKPFNTLDPNAEVIGLNSTMVRLKQMVGKYMDQ